MRGHTSDSGTLHANPNEMYISSYRLVLRHAEPFPSTYDSIHRFCPSPPGQRGRSSMVKRLRLQKGKLLDVGPMVLDIPPVFVTSSMQCLEKGNGPTDFFCQATHSRTVLPE